MYIKEVDGVRIGVFVGHSEPLESVNFHGNLIRVNLSETALGKIVVSPTHNDLLSVGVRLDITSTASLHLKLPDRTDLVYDEAYHTMRKQVRRTILEYLASEGVSTSHRMRCTRKRCNSTFLPTGRPVPAAILGLRPGQRFGPRAVQWRPGRLPGYDSRPG